MRKRLVIPMSSFFVQNSHVMNWLSFNLWSTEKKIIIFHQNIHHGSLFKCPAVIHMKIVDVWWYIGIFVNVSGVKMFLLVSLRWSKNNDSISNVNFFEQKSFLLGIEQSIEKSYVILLHEIAILFLFHFNQSIDRSIGRSIDRSIDQSRHFERTS